MPIIAIEGIRLHAYHGVYPIERREGHDFEVDVYMVTNISVAAQSDSLADTIDYAEVYSLIVQIMEEPVNLLEHLNTKLGKSILDKYRQLESVRVRVSKLQPISMDHCNRTYVEMEYRS